MMIQKEADTHKKEGITKEDEEEMFDAGYLADKQGGLGFDKKDHINSGIYSGMDMKLTK